MKKPSLKLTLGVLSAAVLVGGGIAAMPGKAEGSKGEAPKEAVAAGKPVLNVHALAPQKVSWPIAINANGSVVAWQEAVVGSELGGLRLAEVRVNVGDAVSKGQVLARFTDEAVAAEVAQQAAAVEEAASALAEAHANADRARNLAASGALSAQQIQQALTAERSAKARLGVAQARLNLERIRLGQTLVRAPDAGVISARTATVGSVVGQGQELFKLIRNNRLEWRAELSATDLQRVQPGQVVRLTTANGTAIDGKVRIAAPSIDPNTRQALVYVDLPEHAALRAGSFASGTIELGQNSALALPQNAVITSDGFSYVFKIGQQQKVEKTKVALGRRVGDQVEVLSGVTANTVLVGQGAGFLNDGDTVAVLPTSAAPLVATR